MKKLIAVAVVFALVAGGLFAADFGGAVIGKVSFLGDTTELQDSTPVYSWDAGSSSIIQKFTTDAYGNDWYDGYKAGNNKNKAPQSSLAMGRLRLEGSGGDDVFGGWLRLDGGSFFGYAWWKPIDQFLLRIGGNQWDGFWGKDNVTQWGFHQMANEVGLGGIGTSGDDGAYTAFVGGWHAGGNPSLMMEIKPIDMLGINIGIPFAQGGDADKIFKKSEVQVDMNFDFGNIAITYVGNINDPDKGVAKPGTNEKYVLAEKKVSGSLIPANNGTFTDVYQVPKLEGDGSSIYASVGLGVVENLDLNIGFKFTLPATGNYDNKQSSLIPDPQGSVTTESYTYQAPLAVGIGAKYTVNDQFGIKLRVNAEFAGKATSEVKTVVTGSTTTEYSAEYETPFTLMVGILPYYAVSDNLTVFFSAGMKLTDGEDVVGYDISGKGAYGGADKYATDTKNPNGIITKKSDAVVGFHIMPYVQVGAEWGPTFYAGFKLWSTGAKNISYEKAPAFAPYGSNVMVGGWNNTPAWLKGNDGDAIINWEVPMGLVVSF